jgi:hypothetical protein
MRKSMEIRIVTINEAFLNIEEALEKNKWISVEILKNPDRKTKKREWRKMLAGRRDHSADPKPKVESKYERDVFNVAVTDMVLRRKHSRMFRSLRDISPNLHKWMLFKMNDSRSVKMENLISFRSKNTEYIIEENIPVFQNWLEEQNKEVAI